MIFKNTNIDGTEYFYNSDNMKIGKTEKDVVGKLRRSDNDEDIDSIEWYVRVLEGRSPVKDDPSDALILHLNLNTRCNCKCTYCFRMNGQDLNVGYDVKKAKQIIDIVFEKYKDKIEFENKSISVSVTGEPFMDSKSLFEIIDYIFEKGNGYVKPWNIFIITNGTNISNEDIDKMLSYTPPIQFSISLDGCKEAHDKLRPMKNGESGFDKIADFISRYRKKCKWNIPIDAQMTVVPLVKEQYDLYENIKALNNIGVNTVDVQPIKKANEYWTDERYNDVIERFIKFYERLQKEIILNNNFKALKYVSKISGMITQIHQRYVYSSCGEIRPSQLIIDSNGDVYGCDHFLGNCNYKTKFNIFNNFSREEYFNEKVKNLRKRTLDNFESCKECKYKYLCGGKGFICHLYGSATINMHCTIKKMQYNAVINIYEYICRLCEYDNDKIDEFFKKNKIAMYNWMFDTSDIEIDRNRL